MEEGAFLVLQFKDVALSWMLIGQEGVLSRRGIPYGGSITRVNEAGSQRICVWALGGEYSNGQFRYQTVISHSLDVERALASYANLERVATDRVGSVGKYVGVANVLRAADRFRLSCEVLLNAVFQLLEDAEPVRAGEVSRAALVDAQRAGDQWLQAAARYSLGSALSRIGEPEAALNSFRLALALDVSDAQELALKNYEGLMLQALGDYASAKGVYLDARDLSAKLTHPLIAAVTLNNLGGLAFRSGSPDEALRLFREAYAVQKNAGNVDRMQELLTNQALVHNALGEFHVSTGLLAEVARSSPGAGYRRVDLLTTIADAYAGLGDVDQAQLHLDSAYKERVLEEDLVTKAGVQKQFGQLALQRRDYQDAVRYLSLAASEYMTSGLPVLSEETNCLVAQSLSLSGQYDQALGVIAKHLGPSSRGAIRSEVSESFCWSLVQGLVAIGMNKVGDAERQFLAAIETARRTNDVVGALTAYMYLAELLQAASETARTVQTVEQALSYASEKYVFLYRGKQRRAVHRTFRRLVDLNVSALLEVGSAREAFLSSVNARSLYLRANLRRSDHQESEQEKLHGRKLKALLHMQANMLSQGHAGSDDLADVLIQIAALESDLSSRKVFSWPKRIGFEEIDASLGPDQALLHFHLAPGASYRWKLSDGRLDVQTLPGRDELARAVNALRSRLTSPGAYWSGGGDASAALGRLIFNGLENEHLAPQVFVSADAELHLVPFELLPVGVAEGASTSPSTRRIFIRVPWPSGAKPDTFPLRKVNLLAALKQGANKEAVVPYALPGTAREIDSIRSLLGANALRVFRSTFVDTDTAKTALAEAADVLHVSSHAFVHPTEPGLTAVSARKFGETGGVNGLSALEIEGSVVAQRLVMLTACDTSLGELSDSDGPASLSSAFVQAGARELVSSLWSVSDEATAEFSRLFYRQRAKPGVSSAEAFDQARSMLRGARAWRDPYYWAAFQYTHVPSGWRRAK
jgi:CHAT domain-containing protein/Tfp pilus assembly protein PilF